MAKATEIYVLDRTVRLLQPAEGGFRTSLDSVMLAAACPAGAGDHVLDMGCGVGGAAFCLLRRVPGARVTGVEVQGEYAALAAENVALNGAQGRADFVHADIRDYAAAAPFDHVICNPPYLDAGTHTPAPDGGRAAALGHGDDTMDAATWVDAGFRRLKSRGSLTIIHRADAVDRVVQAMGRRFGGITLIPLWPRAGEAAKRVVIRAVKDSRGPAALHPGLVLHGPDGAYTPAAEGVLRRGEGLF